MGEASISGVPKRVQGRVRLSVPVVGLTTARLMSSYLLRFRRVKEIDMRETPLRPAVFEVGSGDDERLRALSGFTILPSASSIYGVVPECQTTGCRH